MGFFEVFYKIVFYFDCFYNRFIFIPSSSFTIDGFIVLHHVNNGRGKSCSVSFLGLPMRSPSQTNMRTYSNPDTHKTFRFWQCQTIQLSSENVLLKCGHIIYVVYKTLYPNIFYCVRIHRRTVKPKIRWRSLILTSMLNTCMTPRYIITCLNTRQMK